MKCIFLTVFIVLISKSLVVQCSVTSISSAVSSVILDRINVDNYLKNQRMVESHINCILYNASACDTVGREVRRLIPTLGPNNCSTCSTEQKMKLRKILQHWQRYYPQAWRDLTKQAQAAQAALKSGQPINY